MLLLLLITLFSHFQVLLSQAVDANGVSLADRLLAMEIQLLTPQTLLSIVTPCSKLFGADPASGEQTSAEWVRIIFHDAVTRNTNQTFWGLDNVTAGTGGLDASIGFESDRPENVGISFVNVTLSQFSQFFGAMTSMADLIALGLADSLVSCDQDSRLINLRVGRTDATGPGPSGVPQPQDTLASQTAAFANAGFSSTEMIQAIACGHSLGSVHEKNFPDIVPLSFVNDTSNFDGADHFDSTPAQFDNVGVNEYLTGTGLAGGPLVVGPNVTTRSDLRIFSSDGNATIRAMSSPQAFEDTCFTVFEKIINTVPSTVTLSSVIGPRPWILRESHLDLLSSGGVTYSGSITTHSNAVIPATASYQYGTVGGGNTGPKVSNAGVTQPSAAFGNITDYAFNDALNSPSITSMNIQSSFVQPINLNIFVLVSQSFSITTGGDFIIRAALLSTLAPTGTKLTATLYFNNAQPDSVVPVVHKKTASLTSFKTVGAYKVFQGVISSTGTPPSTSFSGFRYVDVRLGTTQVSPKVDVSLLGPCTQSVPTNC